MSLVVNNNLMAANVARNLNAHYGRLQTSTQRLSSGLRINSAADDAAGLSIRELQRADIAAFHQGARNANDAISMIQVADGSLSVIDEKLIRMKELAEQAATGTYDSTQRLMIESEYQAMASEITRIANATDFNGIKLLDGTLAGEHDGSGLKAKGEMKIHFGTGNDSAEDYFYIQIGNCTAGALGVGNTAFDIVRPDPKELIDQTTYEYYEKLRDESAQKAYENTYLQKYEELRPAIYKNLVDGNPPMNGIGIPAEDAGQKADEEARRLAEEYAALDRDMVKASFDKIFEDSWNEPYKTIYDKVFADERQPIYEAAYKENYEVDYQAKLEVEYKANMAAGMTSAEAWAAAEKTASAAARISADEKANKIADEKASKIAYDAASREATKSAILSVKDAAEKIAEDGNLESLKDKGIMPPRNREGADAFIKQVGFEAHEAIYSLAYDKLYTDIRNQVFASKGNIELTADEVLELHEQAHAAAMGMADKFRPQVENAMRAVYDTYDAQGNTSQIFKDAYDAAIAAGYPPEVARHMAESEAADAGWTAMIKAAEDAKAGTPFGLPYDPNATLDEAIEKGMQLHPAEFTEYINTITEFTVNGATYPFTKPVFVAADIPTIYTKTGEGSGAYLDNYGMVYQDSMVNAADKFNTQYNADAAYNEEAIKYNEELARGEHDERVLRDGGTVSTQEAAQKAIVAINDAIVSKDKIRAHLGAMQNRLENTVSNINIMAENLQAAESRISDVDVATEMTEFVRNQILTQSAVAMLAQANSLPQMAMQLIGG